MRTGWATTSDISAVFAVHAVMVIVMVIVRVSASS